MGQDPKTDPDRYPVPAVIHQREEKIQRSRFIAFVQPIQSLEDADAFLRELRNEHHKANHHCRAWRIGHPTDNPAFHYSDDGEPKGSAGLPMFKAIEGSLLSDLQVVVVRYFGGVKLGTGGLVRAYGGVAAQVLKEVERAQVVRRLALEAQFDYSLMTRVLRCLATHDALERERLCSQDVLLKIEVAASERDSLRNELEELFQGQGRVSSP